MANKSYNSPLFLTGMTIKDGEILVTVSQEGRLGTGEIYDAFTAWFIDPDVHENLLEAYKTMDAESILDNPPDGFDPSTPSTWESLLQ